MHLWTIPDLLVCGGRQDSSDLVSQCPGTPDWKLESCNQEAGQKIAARCDCDEGWGLDRQRW